MRIRSKHEIAGGFAPFYLEEYERKMDNYNENAPIEYIRKDKWVKLLLKISNMLYL